MALLEAETDPALLQPEAVASLLASSRDLPDRFMLLDSWFESDTEVDRLLGGKKLSNPKRIALVQDELLPRRAAKWAERLAWTALTLRNGEEDEPWEEFFVSAKELSAGRPPRESLLRRMWLPSLWRPSRRTGGAALFPETVKSAPGWAPGGRGGCGRENDTRRNANSPGRPVTRPGGERFAGRARQVATAVTLRNR